MTDSENHVWHFADSHPILEIKNFISEDVANDVRLFLDLNDNPEHPWGGICFREYWAQRYKHKPKIARRLPQYSKESDKNILENIKSKIYEEVVSFLAEDGRSVIFSIFLSDRHTRGSFTPKRSFPPGVVYCTVPLNDDYSGGELFMEEPEIELKLNARSLYLFMDGPSVEHGVKEVTSGKRFVLVSNWQNPDDPYQAAGAPN